MSRAEITLTPLVVEGEVPEDVVALLVEASHDIVLIASTELPVRMDAARARAHALASDGVVVRVDGTPVGAGFVQTSPSVGEGVVAPPGAVQLDEWLLTRWRGTGILGEGGAWPLLAGWLAQRFDAEVSVTWEDHAGMIAILKARGYERLGRSYWTSPEGGEGTAGWCEVWTYDLRRHRAITAEPLRV